MDKDLDVYGRGLYLLFLLVGTCSAVGSGGKHRTLSVYHDGRLYLPVDVGALYEPLVEKQPDGRRVQPRERIIYAGKPLA